MDRKANDWTNLTTRVSADCPHPRVPPVDGTTMLGGDDIDMVDGGLASCIDSGLDSMISGEISSGYQSGSIGGHSVTQSHLINTTQLQNLTLSDDGDSRVPRLPNTLLEYPISQEHDEGFVSQSLDSLGIENLKDRTNVVNCTEEKTSLPSAIDIQQERIRLLERIFTPDEEGDTQIHIGIIHGETELCNQMINNSPHPQFLNIANELGQTPLHLAALTGQEVIVKSLILKGAQVDLRDRNGNTALHVACREGHLRAVKELTTRQPSAVQKQQIPQDMQARNYEGETCLHLATLNNQLQILEYLTGEKIKADITMRDGRSGRSILHYAAELNYPHIVHHLLEKCRADPNIRAYDNATPYHLAAGRKYDEVLALLLAYGADDAVLPDYTSSDESSDEEDMISEDMSSITHQKQAIFT